VIALSRKGSNQMYELKLKNRRKKSKSINLKVPKVVAKHAKIKPYSYVLSIFAKNPGDLCGLKILLEKSIISRKNKCNCQIKKKNLSLYTNLNSE
jgi:hypothetical protein